MLKFKKTIFVFFYQNFYWLLTYNAKKRFLISYMSLEILECENFLIQIKHARKELLKKKEDLDKAFNEIKPLQSLPVLINFMDKIIETAETNINQSKEKLKTSI